MQAELQNFAITKSCNPCDEIAMVSDDGFSPRQKAFAQFMTLNGLEFRDVERITGVGYSTLKAFATRPNQSMTDRIRSKILAAFRATDADVFISPVKIDENQIGALPDFAPEPDELPTSLPADGMVSIPAYDIKLAAGGGYYADQHVSNKPWNLPKSFVTGELGLNPETLSVVEVIGTSMEPTLRPRDRVLVDHSDQNPSPPGIFAIWDGYGCLVKNLSRTDPKRPDIITITSDNPSYPRSDVNIEDITIIGRVKWFGRRM